MKNITFLLLFFCSSTIAFAGKIVYPWRATTAIVKAGETFEVWHSADENQTLNSVMLRGPYNVVDATIAETKTETWVYDQWSGNTCNQKYTISVPANTPTDRYDLILKTSSGDEISLAAVKVIKEYKNSFYVFHISDAHRWQGGYDANKILRMVATTIDIANIINPEMVIETGDNHYPNTNNVSSTRQRITDYMNGFTSGTEFIKGMNHFAAPVFSIPGNHDTPQKNYALEPDLRTPAAYFNEHYGLQAHNFSYGNARFIGLNNAWFPDGSNGVPNFAHQTDEAKAWLEKAGKGTFRIGYCHVPEPTPLKAFYDPLFKAGAPLNLILAGHVHRASNTFSIKDYPNVKITHTANPLRELHRKAAFNLYKVDLTTNKYTAVGDSIGAHEGLAIADDFSSVKLKLTYSKSNDGNNAENTATIVNKYNFDIHDARVRFVVPKGSEYYLRNATITQQFDGTDFHVIDATYDLEANSTYVISVHPGVQPDLCPDDPDKMDPGLCGCGVPEGSCEIFAAEIALNTTNARMVLNTTRQLKATILPTNTTHKTVNWVSSKPSVATINSDGVITALSEGTTTITGYTYDNAKSATANITVLPSTNTYQAEDAEYLGAEPVTNQPGYNGTAFMDFMNSTNDYIKWNVYVPAEGNYTLTFRYALASSNRPLRLTINDVVKVASLSFPITGAWTNWGTFSTNQQLAEGPNSIMLTAIGSSGGNFDELTISGGGISGLTNPRNNTDGKTMNLYPNPYKSGNLRIGLDGFSNPVNLRITNLVGQLIYSENRNYSSVIELNSLFLPEKSVCFVSVEDNTTKITRKLITH
jgi:hypothetical protein